MKLAVVATLALVPALLSASDAEVRLMDTIAVEAPTVELGEIAYITCDDRELRDAISRIVVCDAPRGGTPRIISSYRVRGALEEAGLAESCEVFGTQTTATLSQREVSQSEVVAAVERWVEENTPQGAEAEVDVVQLSRKWNIPAGREVEITVEPVGKKCKGSVPFTLYALAGGEVLGQMRVRAQINLKASVLLLSRPLKRGEVVTVDHIEEQEIDITDLRGTSLADSGLVIGMASRRDLKAGTILSEQHFEKPVVIKRGTINRLVVRNGNVEMSIAAAQALQDGRKGEVVLFSNPMNAREPLQAKVVREGVALIELR